MKRAVRFVFDREALLLRRGEWRRKGNSKCDEVRQFYHSWWIGVERCVENGGLVRLLFQLQQKQLLAFVQLFF